MKRFVFGIITVASVGLSGLSNAAAVNEHINADTPFYIGDDSIRKDTVRCTNPSGMLENNDGTEKTAVNPKDLPTPIKEALSGEKFREWKTTAAAFVKPTNGHAYYEIALLKDENKTLAKIKSNGKVL